MPRGTGMKRKLWIGCVVMAISLSVCVYVVGHRMGLRTCGARISSLETTKESCSSKLRQIEDILLKALGS